MPCLPSRRKAAKKRARLESLRAADEAAAAAAAADAERAAAALPRPAPLPRPLSRVEAAAGMYEALDAQARAAPALRDVPAALVGARSRKLLDGFERRESEARAVPALVAVDPAGLKAGDRFKGFLAACEEKDAVAAAEPRLEKTFVQREKESVERILALQAAAARQDVVVPTIH